MADRCSSTRASRCVLIPVNAASAVSREVSRRPCGGIPSRRATPGRSRGDNRGRGLPLCYIRCHGRCSSIQRPAVPSVRSSAAGGARARERPRDPDGVEHFRRVSLGEGARDGEVDRCPDIAECSFSTSRVSAQLCRRAASSHRSSCLVVDQGRRLAAESVSGQHRGGQHRHPKSGQSRPCAASGGPDLQGGQLRGGRPISAGTDTSSLARRPVRR